MKARTTTQIAIKLNACGRRTHCDPAKVAAVLVEHYGLSVTDSHSLASRVSQSDRYRLHLAHLELKGRTPAQVKPLLEQAIADALDSRAFEALG